MYRFFLIFLIFSISILAQTELDTLSSHSELNNSHWFDFASFFLGLFLGLLCFLFFKSRKNPQLEKVGSRQEKFKKNEADWSSLFDKLKNQPETEKLYNDLIRKIHPDRFVNHPEKQILAVELFQSLSKAKRKMSLSELKAIKKKAIKLGLLIN
jgi:hypothetical protein